MLKIVGVHMLSGWALRIGILLLAACAFLGFTANTLDFDRGIASAGNYALTAIIFLGPLTAGIAATITANNRRHGTAILATTSARGQRGARSICISVAAAWGILGHSSLAIALFVRSGASVSLRFSDILIYIAGWSLLFLLAAVGIAFGELSTSKLVGLSAVIITFVFVYFTAFLEEGYPKLTFVYPGTSLPVFVDPSPSMFGSKILIAVGLAICILAGWRPANRALYFGAVVVVAGVGLLISAPDRPTVDVATSDPYCTSRSGFSVCTWPQHRERGDMLLSAVIELDEILDPTFEIPGIFREPGAGIFSPGDALVVMPFLEYAQDPTFYADAALNASLPAYECSDESGTRAQIELENYMAEKVGVLTLDDADSKSELPLIKQKQIVDDWLTEIRNCPDSPSS